MKVTNYEIIRTILVKQEKNQRNKRAKKRETETWKTKLMFMEFYWIVQTADNAIRALNNGFPCSMFTFPNFMDSTDY